MSKQDSNRILAHRILQALVDSSLATHFQLYRLDVQAELKLNDEEMKLYDYQTLVELLRPVEFPRLHFKGRELRTGQVPAETVAQAVPPVVPQVQVLPVAQTPPPVQAPAEQAPSEQTHTPPSPEKAPAEQVPVERPLPVSQPEQAEAPQAPQDPQEESEQPEKKKRDPVVKALRRVLKGASIPLDGLTIDAETHPKAVLLKGKDTKQHQAVLTSLEGRWNVRLNAWVFNKEKLLMAREKAKRQSGDKEEDEQSDC